MRKRQNPIFNLLNVSVLIISLIGSAVTVTPARAASIVVNSAVDDTLANLALNSTCDLREAVEASRSYTAIGQCPAGSGADTITFSNTLGTATITLVDFLPYDAYGGMTIDGGSDITISGNNSHRVFYNYGIMTLENITITEGSNASGGAINNAGTLNINNSTFTDNHAGFDGGAIFNAGTLTITNSSFTNNSAGRYGGAIEHYSNNFNSGNLLNATITNSTFTANSAEYGGAITSNDVIDIIKSTFSGNQASNSGGAIYNLYSNAIVTGSTFTNNFARSNGGAFFKANPYFTSSIAGSTFTGNHADLAGGSVYVDAGILNITNSTLYNSYTDFAGAGGGFYNRATLNIRNVTISNSKANSGGGIFNTGGTVNLYNSIIANTTGGGDCSSDSGTVNAGNNLLEDAANFCGIFNGTNNNIVGVDPKLSALADNGGPTQTMELDLTSDAIDNGDDAICNAAPVGGKDQRGYTRPQGARCDIGAFEVDGPPDVTVNQASGQADPTNTSPIKFTVVFDEPIDTASFTDSDLSYTGSTAPGTLSALITEVAPNDGTTFEVEVSGMTGSGNVVLSIEAGRVQDLSGNDNNTSTSTDNIVTYEVDAPTVITTSLQTAYTNTGPNTFTVTFSENVNNAGGGLDTDDATNVNNYLVVEDGLDGTFQTLDCLSGLAGDDTKATVTSISLFAPPPTALVTLSAPLGVGNYRLFVCGTTSITDLTGNHLNNGADFTFDFSIILDTGTPGNPGAPGDPDSDVEPITASALPKTGFAPKQVTTLPAQPADFAYTNLGTLWLEIPSLNLKTTIVGAPRTGDDWELNWLGNDTGWLNGTTFPTWTGNSVLTAHVTNADGLPGPFAELNKLKYGDQVIVHMGGGMYVYEIRNTRLARPYSTSFAFESLKDHSYLTLITCQVYNPLNDSYLFRRVVRAVLVSVEN